MSNTTDTSLCEQLYNGQNFAEMAKLMEYGYV